MPKCSTCDREYTGEACPACAEGASTGSPESNEPPKSMQEFLDSIHPNRYIRTTIKVLLMVLLLGLVTAVVFFSDFVIEWVKGLF